MPSLRGKNLSPVLYKAIGNFWRERFGMRSHWSREWRVCVFCFVVQSFLFEQALIVLAAAGVLQDEVKEYLAATPEV